MIVFRWSQHFRSTVAVVFETAKPTNDSDVATHLAGWLAEADKWRALPPWAPDLGAPRDQLFRSSRKVGFSNTTHDTIWKH